MNNPLSRFVRAYSTMYKVNKFNIEQQRKEYGIIKIQKELEKARRNAEIDAQIQRYNLEREYRHEVKELERKEKRAEKVRETLWANFYKDQAKKGESK